MPVTKSAKKALKVSHRRHSENLDTKQLYKRAVKTVRKAVSEGVSELASIFSAAQSALDTAAKKNVIHPNKAARLSSRLSKRMKAAGTEAAPAAVKKTAKRSTAKKPVAKKTTKSKK